MSNFIVLEGHLPESYKIEFERFLFNTERHRRSQTLDEWDTFSLLTDESNKVLAQIHFYTSNGVAYSPHHAPSGSVEFADGLAPDSLLFFFSEIEKRLNEKGVHKILIKDAPHQYRHPQSALLSILLLDFGFRLHRQEINSGIVIDEATWEHKISHAESKRLKRCRNEGLAFRILPDHKGEMVYNFIQSCREERGMSLSMSWAQVTNTITLCKDDFLFFGVFRKNEIMAASISIKVNNRIVYDFYHAHAKSTDHLSPVVALIDGIYSYCQRNEFSLLDLGTSMVDEKINFSLLNFKTQIGGDPSLKLTYEKDLA